MFGVWVGPGAAAPVLRANQFANVFVAGAYTNAAFAGQVEMSANTFRLPTPALNTDNPPQLDQAYALAPGADRQEAYGVLAQGAGVYRPSGNQFRGVVVLGANADLRPTYRHVGFSASAATPSTSVVSFSDNYCNGLYEGMRLRLKANSSITGSTFLQCVVGLHLVGAGTGSGGPAITHQVQCNTFLMGSLGLFSANSPGAFSSMPTPRWC